MHVIGMGAGGDEDEFAQGDGFGDLTGEHTAHGHADHAIARLDLVVRGEELGVVSE
jgi:hypothetical protein